MTYRDIITAVRALAAEHPDAVYVRPDGTTRCYYTRGTAGGGCGCIVGQAILRVDPSQLATLEGADGRLSVLSAFSLVGAIGEGTAEELKWLLRVQSYQDDGRTWRYCVERADTLNPLPTVDEFAESGIDTACQPT